MDRLSWLGDVGCPFIVIGHHELANRKQTVSRHLPLIKTNITDRDERIRFTADPIRVFVKEDMDTWNIEPLNGIYVMQREMHES